MDDGCEVLRLSYDGCRDGGGEVVIANGVEGGGGVAM